MSVTTGSSGIHHRAGQRPDPVADDDGSQSHHLQRLVQQQLQEATNKNAASGVILGAPRATIRLSVEP
jgi:hypothetical protein